ncbi:MAG: NeuD/PglB/VioB family sugar acetyltransferase [Ilumatobacteraceae bacterium]
MGSLRSARVLVVGASGHARVCIEALHDSGHMVVGCVSRDGVGAIGLPCPVIATDADLAAAAAACGADSAFVAIGDNAGRAAASERCAAAGLPLVNAISRFAMVSSSATLGRGVAILAGVVVNAGATVDDGVIVNTRASVDHDCSVGAFAHVAVGVSLAGGVRVGRQAFLGIGAAVLPGCVIGANSTVGGGAVVIADVAPGITVVGVPARPVRPR